MGPKARLYNECCRKLGWAGPWACLILVTVLVDKVQSFNPKLLPSRLEVPSDYNLKIQYGPIQLNIFMEGSTNYNSDIIRKTFKWKVTLHPSRSVKTLKGKKFYLKLQTFSVMDISSKKSSPFQNGMLQHALGRVGELFCSSILLCLPSNKLAHLPS